MFYSSQDGQYIQEGSAFEIAGVQYPSNWLNLSTPAEKTALGLEEVVATNSPANDKFYWVSEALNGASLTYTNTAKDLFTCQSNEVNATNAAAYSILLPSDWMATKAFETGTTVATEWATWRAQIRSQAATQIAAINACTTIEQLAALPNVAWAKNPNAPVDPA
jgi:hypothetical protein